MPNTNTNPASQQAPTIPQQPVPQQGTQQQPPPQPEVNYEEIINNIMAMGICGDRDYIEKILRKANGDANLAMAWILEPEEMLRQEQAAKDQQRQHR